MARSAAAVPVLLLALHPFNAAAQTPARRPNMQQIADGLGVRCTYCHVEVEGRTDYRADHPMKRIARVMIAMTADINAAIASAVLKSDADMHTVTCMTCHRGVTDPRPIDDILTQIIDRDTPEAAIAKYRELRAKYFGHDSYDFSEMMLLRVAQRYVERVPSTAMAIAKLNLEFFPASASSYVVMGIASTRMLDDRTAIGYFERALEMEPANGVAQGYLEQLRQYQKRK
jgi:hypothetical protein